MQQTMDVTRDTPAPARPDMQNHSVLLEEWVSWCRSTGREAHAADLIERTRAELRNS
jgi:hypothetical protein